MSVELIIIKYRFLRNISWNNKYQFQENDSNIQKFPWCIKNMIDKCC